MERNPCETKESVAGSSCVSRTAKHGVFSVGRRSDRGRAEGEGPADQASGKVGKGLDPMAGLGSRGAQEIPHLPRGGQR